jgi:hypothetical protein
MFSLGSFRGGSLGLAISRFLIHFDCFLNGEKSQRVNLLIGATADAPDWIIGGENWSLPGRQTDSQLIRFGSGAEIEARRWLWMFPEKL